MEEAGQPITGFDGLVHNKVIQPTKDRLLSRRRRLEVDLVSIRGRPTGRLFRLHFVGALMPLLLGVARAKRVGLIGVQTWAKGAIEGARPCLKELTIGREVKICELSMIYGRPRV